MNSVCFLTLTLDAHLFSVFESWSNLSSSKNVIPVILLLQANDRVSSFFGEIETLCQLDLAYVQTLLTTNLL